MIYTEKSYYCGCFPHDDTYCLEAEERVARERRLSHYANQGGLTREDIWDVRCNARTERRWVLRHLQEQEDDGDYTEVEIEMEGTI